MGHSALKLGFLSPGHRGLGSKCAEKCNWIQLLPEEKLVLEGGGRGEQVRGEV